MTDAVKRIAARMDSGALQMLRALAASDDLNDSVRVYRNEARAIVAHIDALTADRDAALAKVPKIVAWLREHDDDDADWYALGPFKYIATAIERGEYEEVSDATEN